MVVTIFQFQERKINPLFDKDNSIFEYLQMFERVR